MSGLDIELLRSVRKSLIVGLQALGEIERLDNAWEVHSKHLNLPESARDALRPIHPTGAADTVGQFADALSILDMIEDDLIDTK